MASYLYWVNKDGTVVLDEEAVKLAPVLGKLKQNEVRFVILFVDYGSPYHQLPDAERLRRVKRQVFGTEDSSPETQKLVIEAMEEYRGLQYDVEREMLKNYEAKIVQYSEEVLNEKNPRRISELDSAISVLQQRCEKIRDKLDRNNENELVLKGNRRMSFVEKWQASQREFRKAQQRKLQVQQQDQDANRD